MQTASSRRGRRKKRVGASCALALAMLLVGCGSGGSSQSKVDPTTITDTAAVSPIARSCPAATLEAIEGVAQRVYQESASGRIVAEALARLKSSSALAQAVEGDDRAAAHRVLEGLLLNQIVSVRVTRDGRTLTKIERAAGIAPRSESLVNALGQTVGEVTVSVQGANGYAQTVSGLLHAQVMVRSGRRQLIAT